MSEEEYKKYKKDVPEGEILGLMAVVDLAAHDLGLEVNDIVYRMPEVEQIIGLPQYDEDGKRKRAKIDKLTPLQAFTFGLSMGYTYRGRLDKELDMFGFFNKNKNSGDIFDILSRM